MKKKEINPRELTLKTIENFLGKENICLIYNSITTFGDGPTIFIGQKVDGEQLMAISFYQEVYNAKARKLLKKTLPTIIIEDYMWNQRNHLSPEDLSWYIRTNNKAKIIERVEKFEMTDKKIVFWGTIGQEERKLEIYKDGTYLYISPNLKLRNDVINVIKEVETLRNYLKFSLRISNYFKFLLRMWIKSRIVF